MAAAYLKEIRVPALLCFFIILQWSSAAIGMPAFARQYDLTCAACHDAFPRLNTFGQDFADNNFRLPNWRETMLDLGDERLALPKQLPLAVRAQAFVQWRDAEEIDVATGARRDADTDFQAPYLVKLLSSAPLSEHVSYYFYVIFAEKGGNGETILEDAWIQYSDIAGSGIAAQLGQFQVSDLMFPREVRLTFQDYYVYRAAGSTYERGLLFSGDLNPVNWAIGLVNGNGIEDNFDINAPGYRRPDKMFDNDNDKSVFGRVGTTLGAVDVGLFALSGEQRSAAGFAGTERGDHDSDKKILGLDVAGSIRGNIHWYGQILWNQWDDFLDANPSEDYDWLGGFVGLDYIPNDRWAFSLLWNYAEADDFDDTQTIYEGIDMNSLTGSASYYLMRNVKAVFEVNFDFLGKTSSGPPFVGHQSRENYMLFGFDVAF